MKRTRIQLFLALAGIFLITGISHAQVKPGWPKLVTVGSAPIGGVYYVWAGGFSKLLHDRMGLAASVEVTGGPVQNTQLVDNKQMDLGMTSAGPVYEGWHGLGWAKGRKYQNVRAIFPMFQAYIHTYVLKKSGIKTLYDLAGKSVGVGPAGGTTDTYFRSVLEAAGVKPSRYVHGSLSDLNSLLKDGMLDSNTATIGIPWGLIHEIETTHEVNVIGVPKEAGGKYINKAPFFSPGVIPKGTYKANKDMDVETIVLWGFMIAHKDTSEDFVYEVVKKTFENVEVLIAVHPTAKEMKPEVIVYSPVPLHPGALKYYNEKGIKIPDKLIPPK